MMSLPWPIVSLGIMTAIFLIGVFVVWRMIKDRRSGFPPQDERTQRITGKAASYAILIGSYFTIGLLFVNIINQEFFGFPAFEAGYALIASLLTYSLSFIGLRLYFDRKGDF